MNYIVLDTETCNGLEDALIYDVGWVVVSDKKEILASHSIAIKDVFVDEIDLMKNAYYADKLPQYWTEIYMHQRDLFDLHHTKNLLAYECDKYKVKAIIRHNALFDYKSCTTTQRLFTSSKYRYFFPYGIEIWDTLKMARQVFSHDTDYIAFCKENGYMTAHKTPRVRLTAEILFRYITKDNTFVESHTGLADVMIEKDIFFECIKRNPQVEKCLWTDRKVGE